MTPGGKNGTRCLDQSSDNGYWNLENVRESHRIAAHIAIEQTFKLEKEKPLLLLSQRLEGGVHLYKRGQDFMLQGLNGFFDRIFSKGIHSTLSSKGPTSL